MKKYRVEIETLQSELDKEDNRIPIHFEGLTRRLFDSVAEAELHIVTLLVAASPRTIYLDTKYYDDSVVVVWGTSLNLNIIIRQYI